MLVSCKSKYRIIPLRIRERDRKTECIYITALQMKSIVLVCTVMRVLNMLKCVKIMVYRGNYFDNPSVTYRRQLPLHKGAIAEPIYSYNQRSASLPCVSGGGLRSNSEGLFLYPTSPLNHNLYK